MKHLLRAGAAFLVTLPLLFSQTPPPSPLTVTPTQVTVQLGQPLYCAARWTKATVSIQLYCYTSSANHTWDLLIYNSVFPVNTSATLPYVLLCPNGVTAACTSSSGILWIFRQDPKTPGTVDWQVSWNGFGFGQGTFQ